MLKISQMHTEVFSLKSNKRDLNDHESRDILRNYSFLLKQFLFTQEQSLGIHIRLCTRIVQTNVTTCKQTDRSEIALPIVHTTTRNKVRL